MTDPIISSKNAETIAPDELAELKLLAKHAELGILVASSTPYAEYLCWQAKDDDHRIVADLMIEEDAAYLVAAANAVPRLLDKLGAYESMLNDAEMERDMFEYAYDEQVADIAALRARIVELETENAELKALLVTLQPLVDKTGLHYREDATK
jgi:hypothetical protein